MSSSADSLAEIRKLPHSVSSMTRSCLSITSYASCITELVCNAIDAGATCVAVRVDFNCHRIQVVDNGHGIDKKNLENIAERHMTSKIRSINDLENCLEKFGFRGEALASIREISRLLKFSSKPASSRATFEKEFLEGNAGAVTCVSTERPSPGTTVTVQDFLHNVPVRRKKISELYDTEDIKVQLECLALVHPHMSISFKNDATGKMVLEIRKCASAKDVFGQLFGPVLSDHLKELTFDSGKGVQVHGYVSTRGHYSKSYQLIYVNRRIVVKTQLHKSVIHLLSWMLRAEKKQKYPVFILNLTCPYAIYDITFDPKKTQIEFKNWSVIVQTFEEAVKQFLRQNRIEAPPENKKKCSEMSDNRGTWNLVSNGHTPKLGLWKTVSGAISKRQNSNQNIVNEVLQKSQNDEFVHSPPMKQLMRKITMPTKKKSAAKPSCSSSSINTITPPPHYVHSPPQQVADKRSGPGWDQKVVRYEMYCKYCTSVQKSVKLFLDADQKAKQSELPSQPSQPLSSQENSQKATTLTQGICHMGVNTEEPPDEIYQRHATFDFQPVIKPEASDEIYLDASNSSACMDVEMQQLPSSSVTVDERFSQYNRSIEKYPVRSETSAANNYYTKSLLIKKKDPLPDLSILQHLSPTSSMYREIIEAFTSEKSKSPVLEKLRPEPFSFSETSAANNYYTKSPLIKKKDPLQDLSILQHLSPTSSMYREIIEAFTSDKSKSPVLEKLRPAEPFSYSPMTSQMYYSPKPGSMICPESPSVEEEVEQYEPEEIPYNALNLFDDAEQDSQENYSQKRKKSTPLVTDIGCKKMKQNVGEWQLNQNELGEEFFVNQRTGQVAASVPKMAEEFSMRERCTFMPFGTSPIMQLAPSCELKMDFDVKQKLNQTVEENFNQTGDASAASKWESLEEFAAERNRLGLLDEMIQRKVLDAGLRPMPVLEKKNLFADEAFIKMKQSLFQSEIPSAVLNTARVVGQFDKKFMVIMSDYKATKSNLVLLIDQHAAHERVRLEELTKGYQSASQQFLHAPLHLPQNVSLTKHETRMVQECQSTFQKYGLECEALSETEVRVFSVPLCFVKKHQRQQPKHGWNLEEAVSRLIRELVDDLQETRGVCLTIPKEIRDVLNSEACSGAAKFNTAFSRSALTDLLQQLSKCKLPFQCAHGRNSTFSALDLDKIKSKEVKKPNISAFVKKCRQQERR